MAPRIVARPLPAYAAPAYPCRADLTDGPRFLLRHLPRRWRRDRLLLVLLAGTLPAAEGCPDPAAGVAPVSEHGAGIGWFGCEVIVPPVFLSEAEAMAVVRDELELAGLSGMAEGVDLPDVEVARIEVEDCGDRIEAGSALVPFQADLFDEARQLAIETFTEEDFNALATDGDPGCDSSVDTHDLRAAAGVLAGELERRGAGRWYGVAYDPVASPDGEAFMGCWEAEDPEACAQALLADAAEQGEADLRAQVQDLVAWMREKGLL